MWGRKIKMDKKKALYEAIGAIAMVSLDMDGKNYEIQIDGLDMSISVNERYVPCVNVLIDLMKN